MRQAFVLAPAATSTKQHRSSLSSFFDYLADKMDVRSFLGEYIEITLFL